MGRPRACPLTTLAIDIYGPSCLCQYILMWSLILSVINIELHKDVYLPFSVKCKMSVELYYNISIQYIALGKTLICIHSPVILSFLSYLLSVIRSPVVVSDSLSDYIETKY